MKLLAQVSDFENPVSEFENCGFSGCGGWEEYQTNMIAEFSPPISEVLTQISRIAFAGEVVIVIVLLAAYAVVRNRFPHAMAWVRRAFFAAAALMTVAYAGFMCFLFYAFTDNVVFSTTTLTSSTWRSVVLPLLLPASLLLFVTFVIDRRNAPIKPTAPSPVSRPRQQ